MPAASATFTDAIYKLETTYGVLPSASGAQYLRRTSLALDLEKETYESNEQRTDSQVADFRHGARKATGKLAGELSAGSYADFFAAILRRDWNAPGDITGLSLTIAASGGNYTLTRAAGDFLAAGAMNVGSVWQISAGGVNANNLNKRFLVLNVTTLAITVTPLNGSTMTAEGPIASCTLSMPGKRNFMPTTAAAVLKSFAIEKYFGDLVQSEVYTGMKVKGCSVRLPATGLATVEFDMEGQNITVAAARYYNSPTVALGTKLFAAVNGVCRAAGAIVGNITGIEFTIMSGLQAEAVVGTNTRAEPFNGRLRMSGQVTTLFDSVTLRDAFLAESEVELIVALTGDNLANPQFMSFAMTRCKLGKAGKSDQTDAGVIQTIPFTALLQVNGGPGTKYEATTLLVQDGNA